MRVKLLKNRYDIEFLDGGKPINANDVMVNTLKVDLEQPLLNKETLWVSFSKVGAGIYGISKPILATNNYTVEIPAKVVKIPGEWEIQLFIKTYDTVQDVLLERAASKVVTFTVENGLYVDDEMDLANNASIASLYEMIDENSKKIDELDENAVKKQGSTMSGTLIVGEGVENRTSIREDRVVVSNGNGAFSSTVNADGLDIYHLHQTNLPNTKYLGTKIEHAGRSLLFPTPTEGNNDETLATEHYVDKSVEPIKSDIEGLQEELNLAKAQHTSDIEGVRKDIINESHFRGYLRTNADVKALPGNANDYAYSAESGTTWIYGDNGWEDNGVPVPDQVTPASNATPLMDGEATSGQEGAYARGDHRHPSDTSKVSKSGDAMTGDLSFIGESGLDAHVGLGGAYFSHSGRVVYTDIKPSAVSVKSPNVNTKTSYLPEGIEHEGRSLLFPTPTEGNDNETLATEHYVDELYSAINVTPALSFDTYQKMIEELLKDEWPGKHPIGTSIYIETVNVPDLWVSFSGIEYDANYPTTDEEIVRQLNEYGFIQVGVYRLAQLETGKVDITNLVKKDDIDPFYGLTFEGDKLSVIQASKWAIDNRKNYNSASFIGHKMVDYAVKAGMTTNTETWSDDEKAAACETIGAVKKYVGSSGNIYIPAIKGGEGTQTQYRLSEFYQQGLGTQTIPLRDSEGGLRVQENPTNPLHAVPKQWVEGLTKLYKHTFEGLIYDESYDESERLSNLMVISRRSTPYTNMQDIVSDFGKPSTFIVATLFDSGIYTRTRCEYVHPYGGFYFYPFGSEHCVAPNEDFVLIDEVSEYEEE